MTMCLHGSLTSGREGGEYKQCPNQFVPQWGRHPKVVDSSGLRSASMLDVRWKREDGRGKMEEGRVFDV